MKKLLKLSLVAGMMIASLTHAEENRFYTLSHGWFNLGRHAGAVAGPLVTLGKFLHLKYTMRGFPDAPEAVVAFCREKLKEHAINPDTIIIKTREHCSIMEAFPGIIIFNPDVAQQLNNALANPTDAESQRVLGINSTFLDHEIGHLKSNDNYKNLAVLTGASLATYLASSYLIETEYLKPWFKKPDNIKEFFIAYGAYSVLAFLNQTIIKSITQWYSRNLEHNADAYAITHAKNPEALRAAADCLEKIDNRVLDFICSDIPANPDLSTTTIMKLNVMRAILKLQYQAENPQEDMRTWVQKQTGILEDMLNVVDPEHPRAYIRAEKMREAADALQAEQQQLPAPC